MADQKQKIAAKNGDMAKLFCEIEKAKKALESISQDNELNKKSIAEIQGAVDNRSSTMEKPAENNKNGSIRNWLRASLEEERRKTRDLEGKVASLESELRRLRGV